MQDLEMICFKMISNLGAARSLFMEALQAAKAYEFDKARQLIEEGESYRLKGHDVHFELLSKESSGEGENVTLLLLHAEDQLMSSEIIKLLAEETIGVYETFHQFENND
ncbi:PTS lactose/cellobiose transporter subunit IIA [Streptococcus respiraculi]|uniref:PTS lactose/cellobiose transporter subunit IIA n=1 Tax=Streptococcus respiraculi TaxID=2021971 RepID=UPI00197FCB29|nr:PTS lactose/cellobiose transporter subunit IIA [Streptococcus respiraculi]